MKTLNQKLISLVNILNDQQFHDGNIIGNKLDITRSAVWKMIEKLKQYEINIDSVKGKGYILREPLILLQTKKIKKQLADYRDLTINCFETIDSTINYLTDLSHDKRSTKPAACLTEHQSQGKGRFEKRSWHSPFGRNVYFSLLYSFSHDVSELSGLSLVAALAISKLINRYLKNDQILIKWPNDIFYQGKKMAGVVIHIQSQSHGLCHAIVSTGININIVNDKQHHIGQPWTSLQKITGQYIDRNTFCAELIKQLMNDISRFSQQGFDNFQQQWSSYDYLLNKKVHFKLSNSQQISGIAKGINQLGHLIIEQENGQQQAFSSGEVSTKSL